MKIENPEVVPDAVKKQAEDAERMMAEARERRAKAKSAQAQAAKEPTPSTAEPVSTPKAEDNAPASHAVDTGVSAQVQGGASETPEQTMSRYEATIRDLQRKIDTMHGTHGGTIQNLKSQIFDLQQKLEGVVTGGSRPVTPASEDAGVSNGSAPAVGEAVDGSDLLKFADQEDLERYGEPLFKSFAKMLKGALDTKSKEFKMLSIEAQNKLLNVERQMKTEEFWREAERLEPGAKKVNGNTEKGLPCEEGWGRFLDTPIRPGSPISRREEAERAFVGNQPDVFAALVKEFKALKYGAKNEINRPTRPSVHAQAVPRSTTGSSNSGTPQGDSGKRRIPQSEINSFMANAGKGKMTIDEANRLTKEYAEAMAEGRVLQSA